MCKCVLNLMNDSDCEHFRQLSNRTLWSLYFSFIKSNFLYCSNVWHFGLRSNFWHLEKMNQRALQVVLNDYSSSYPELLTRAKSNCTYVQNIHVLMIEWFKYINGINLIPLHMFLTYVITRIIHEGQRCRSFHK